MQNIDIQSICAEVLEACCNGKFHQDLKILYQAQHREKINWLLFPNWAIPNAQVEGCHEG